MWQSLGLVTCVAVRITKHSSTACSAVCKYIRNYLQRNAYVSAAVPQPSWNPVRNAQCGEHTMCSTGPCEIVTLQSFVAVVGLLECRL